MIFPGRDHCVFKNSLFLSAWLWLAIYRDVHGNSIVPMGRNLIRGEFQSESGAKGQPVIKKATKMF